MTDAEDEHNAALNELICACQHATISSVNGVILCGQCPARFMVVLYPRRAKPSMFTLDDDD